LYATATPKQRVPYRAVLKSMVYAAVTKSNAR
jgi:hypothetical protein